MTLKFKETNDILVLNDNQSGTYYDKFGNIVGVDYSNTSLAIEVVQKTLFLNADNGVDRDYKVGDYVLLTSKSGATGTMFGTVSLYTPSNQGLMIDVISITGTGTGTSWRVTHVAPRQDYHPDTGVLRGARFEPSSINLLTFSDAASVSVQSGTISTAIDTTVLNPAGDLSVNKIEVTGSGVVRIGDTTNGITSTQYVGSVYIMSLVGGETVSANLNGVNSQNFVVSNLFWTRIWAQGSTATTDRYMDITLPVGTYYVWGKQIESVFDYPTSYIPTGDVEEGRGASYHTVSTTFLDTVDDGTEYTLFVEFEFEVFQDENTNYTVADFSDGTLDNRVSLGIVSAGSFSFDFLAQNVAGSVETFGHYFGANSIVPTAIHKAAISFKENQFQAALDNVISSIDVSGAFPTGLSELTIGGLFGGALPFRGWIKEATLYPVAYLDNDLLELTDNIGTPLTVP